jgi:hypothetical protein
MTTILELLDTTRKALFPDKFLNHLLAKITANILKDENSGHTYWQKLPPKNFGTLSGGNIRQ